MPEMDGFDLAVRIRNSPHLTDAVVMMLTSGEQRDDVARCRELHIRVHLIKPVRRAELRAAIATALAGGPGTREQEITANPPAPQNSVPRRRTIRGCGF